MRPLFLNILLLSASGAHADSFKIVRDGQEYTCTSSGPRDPGSAVDCVNKAYNGPFSRSEAMEICAGATGNGPAECGIKAYNGPFSRVEAVELCKRNGSLANAECAIKAYNGPYSRAEAMQLCKTQPQLMMRSLNLMQQSQEIQSKVLQMKILNPLLQQ